MLGPSQFHNITGLNDYDNFMNTNAPADFGYYAPYLNQPEIRQALHVGNATFPSAPSTCEKHLLADFMVRTCMCMAHCTWSACMRRV